MPEPIVLQVPGMTCSACVAHVGDALRSVPGVSNVAVSLTQKEAHVELSAEGPRPETDALISALDAIGFDASTAKPPQEESPSRYAPAVTLGLGALAMVVGMPLMGHDDVIAHALLGPLEQGLVRLWPGLYQIPRWVLEGALAVTSFVVMATLGRKVITTGLLRLAKGVSDMNSLVALGALTAWLFSLGSWIFGGGGAYWETSLVILGFVLLGKDLEARAVRLATRATRELWGALPQETFRVNAEGQTNKVASCDLLPGDRVRVFPFSRVPADGTIVEGQAEVSEALLTGEAAGVFRRQGERVLGGTENLSTTFDLAVEKLGVDTRIGKILSLVEAGELSKVSLQRTADKISRIFVPGVIALSALVLTVWLACGASTTLAFRFAVATLVVACPCALGFAVPMALVVGTGRAARLGILFRSGEAMVRLARIDACFFDKTGTLTRGDLEVVETRTAPTWTEEQALRTAAALASKSRHPASRAIVRGATSRSLGELPSPTELKETPGVGLGGRVQGVPFFLGKDRGPGENSATASVETDIASAQSDMSSTKAPRRSPGPRGTLFLHDGTGERWAEFDVVDEVRPEARDAILALRARAIRAELLSGDGEAPCRDVAERVGLSKVRFAQSPEEKMRVIARHPRAAMVGDGWNDAAAVSVASVGVSLSSGTDATLDASDVTLTTDRLTDLVKAIDLSRAAYRTVRRNLALSIGYNLLAIPLAAGLFYPLWNIALSPPVASLAMAMSSVSVVLSSLLQGTSISRSA